MANGTSSARTTFLHAGLWLAGSQVLVFALYFLTQRIILSTLTKEENGELVFVRRLAELTFGLFVELGLNGVAVRRCALSPEYTSTVLSSVVMIRLVMWGVAALVASVAAVGFGYDPWLVIVWGVFVLISSRNTLLRYTLEVPHRINGRMRFVAILAVLDPVIVLVALTLYRDTLTPANTIMIMCAGVVAGFLVMAAASRATISFRWVSFKEIKSLLSEAVPIIVSRTLLVVDSNIEFFILQISASAASMGIVGAVHTVVGPAVGLIPFAFTMAAAPIIAKFSAQIEKSLPIVRQLIRLTIIVSIILAAFLDALMPDVLIFTTQGKYSSYVHLFSLLVWSAPFTALYIATQEISVVLRRSPVFTYVSLISIVLAVSLSLILIPSYDTLGAVLARVITLSVVGAVCVVGLNKMVPGVLKGSQLVRLLLLYGISVTGSYLSRDLLPPLALALINPVAVVALAVLLRVIGQTDIDFVLNRFRRRGGSDE